MKPMLLSPTDDVELLSLAHDASWAFSTKLDGKRRLVRIGPYPLVRSYTRSGEQRDLPVDIMKAIETIPVTVNTLILDGELMHSGNFKIFDLVALDYGKALIGPDHPAYIRDIILSSFLASTLKPGSPISAVEYAYETRDKLNLWKYVLKHSGEGVVARHLESTYEFGITSPLWKKWKVRQTVDCVVMDRGVNGKDNLLLGLYQGGTLVPVGKCSALTGDGPDAKVGDVVTVSYQSFSPSGKLVLPSHPVLYPEKHATDCGMGQVVPVNLHSIEGGWG